MRARVSFVDSVGLRKNRISPSLSFHTGNTMESGKSPAANNLNANQRGRSVSQKHAKPSKYVPLTRNCKTSD